MQSKLNTVRGPIGQTCYQQTAITSEPPCSVCNGRDPKSWRTPVTGESLSRDVDICIVCACLLQLNWTKNTWGKGMVQGGAETDAKQYYPRLVALLKQQAGSTLSSSDIDPIPVAQGAEDAAAVAARAVSSGSWQLYSGRVGVLLLVCLVLSLLVLALAVWSAGRNISSSMRELGAAAAAGQFCNTGGQTDSMLPGPL